MTHERIYVWFADNGSIRKWDRCPFPEGVEYVRADLLAAAQAERNDALQLAEEASNTAWEGTRVTAKIAAERDAAQAEARELREKLERMVEIREAAVDVMGNALRLNGGGFHVYQRPLERLIAALSLPAAEQLDDWLESRVDVIGQNGNDGDHYEQEQRKE